MFDKFFVKLTVRNAKSLLAGLLIEKFAFQAIMKAECADSRSWAMQQVNIDQLCTLFGFALQRMKHPDVIFFS